MSNVYAEFECNGKEYEVRCSVNVQAFVFELFRDGKPDRCHFSIDRDVASDMVKQSWSTEMLRELMHPDTIVDMFKRFIEWRDNNDDKNR